MGSRKTDDNPANRDPITGAPGSHPVGTAAGTTSGGVAGAAIGTAVGGPVGGAVGAAVGAVAGGLAGHAAGEAVNPSVEDIYWRQAHIREPYYRKDFTYDDYGPAYRTGWEGASRYYGQNRRFDDVEPSCAATISASRVNRDSPGKMRRPRPALPGIASSGPCRATQTTTVVSVQVPAASFARRLASCPTRGSIYGEAAGTDKATT
jgi:hypothetical protein